MNYIGSLNQRGLADAVSQADILAFPSTYPETSCITAMEAMISSTIIVATQLGALPETTAGFAHLLPSQNFASGELFVQAYARFLVGVVRQYLKVPEQGRSRLELQRHYALQNYNWETKAGEWEELLEEVLRRRSTARLPTSLPVIHQEVNAYAQTITGERIYLDLRDQRARRLLTSGGNFNPQTMKLWQAALALTKWQFIVDVGANDGEMLLNGGLDQASTVLALEPNPAILPYLR